MKTATPTISPATFPGGSGLTTKRRVGPGREMGFSRRRGMWNYENSHAWGAGQRG